MNVCEETARYIRSLLLGTAVLFSLAPGGIALAIFLNDGFFTAPLAPVPMFAAATAAAAAVGNLRYLLAALDEWADPQQFGCVPRGCFETLRAFRSAVLAAIGSLAALAAACASVALKAWIPWVPQAAMWAVFLAAGAAAATLAYLLVLFGKLRGCEARVASAVGPLRTGEKMSDPWFLRLEPLAGADFAKPIDSALGGSAAISNHWLECWLLDVRKWEVGAVATILGSPAAPVKFEWLFGGKPVAGSSSQAGTAKSTLNLQSQPASSPLILAVTAVDQNGFTRSLQVEVTLSPTVQKCHLVLHFVPPFDQLPTKPPGPVEISAHLAQLIDLQRRVQQDRPLNS